MLRERYDWKEGIDTEGKYYPALHTLLILVHNSIIKNLCMLKVSNDGHKQNCIYLQGRKPCWLEEPKSEKFYSQRMTRVNSRGMEWVIDWFISVNPTRLHISICQEAIEGNQHKSGNSSDFIILWHANAWHVNNNRGRIQQELGNEWLAHGVSLHWHLSVSTKVLLFGIDLEADLPWLQGEKGMANSMVALFVLQPGACPTNPALPASCTMNSSRIPKHPFHFSIHKVSTQEAWEKGLNFVHWGLLTTKEGGGSVPL